MSSKVVHRPRPSLHIPPLTATWKSVYCPRRRNKKGALCLEEERSKVAASLDMGTHVPPPRENEAGERSLPSLSGLMEQYSPSRARAASAGQQYRGGRGGYPSSSTTSVGGGTGGEGGAYFGTAFSNRALDRSELALSVSSERSSSPLSLGSRTQPAGPGTSSSSTSSTTSTTTNMAATATTTGGAGAAGATGVGTGSALGTGHLRPPRPVPHRLLPGLGSSGMSSGTTTRVSNSNPSESTL